MAINDNTVKINALIERISALPEQAPVPVLQRQTGTFTTSNGEATVNCGFQPDLVVIHKNESIEGYCQSCAFAFAEDTRSKTLNAAMWTSISSVTVYDVAVTQTSNGFSVGMLAYDDSWSESTPRTTFTYIAVKYDQPQEVTVLPETACETTFVDGYSYSTTHSLSVTPSAGDVLICYVHDTRYEMTLYENGTGYLNGSVGGSTFFATVMGRDFLFRMAGNVGTVRLKVTMPA